MSLALKQLTADCNCDNKSNGVVAKLYYAPICDFLAIQEIDAAETDIDEYGVIPTAHTFTSPKGFIQVDLEDGENTLKMAKSGTKGYGNWKTTFEGLNGGYNRKIRGFLNQQTKCKGIAIAELTNGQRIQIGNADHPCYLSADFDSTKTDDSGPFGFKMMFEANTPLIYEYAEGLAITLAS